VHRRIDWYPLQVRSRLLTSFSNSLYDNLTCFQSKWESDSFLQSPADLTTLSPFTTNRIYMLFEDSNLPLQRAVIKLKVTPSDGEDIKYYEIEPILCPQPDSILHTLGARALLEDLERGQSELQLTKHPNDAAIRREGERLGCKFSLVSKWTSLVAVGTENKDDGNVEDELSAHTAAIGQSQCSDWDPYALPPTAPGPRISSRMLETADEETSGSDDDSEEEVSGNYELSSAYLPRKRGPDDDNNPGSGPPGSRHSGTGTSGSRSSGSGNSGSGSSGSGNSGSGSSGSGSSGLNSTKSNGTSFLHYLAASSLPFGLGWTKRNQTTSSNLRVTWPKFLNGELNSQSNKMEDETATKKRTTGPCTIIHCGIDTLTTTTGFMTSNSPLDLGHLSVGDTGTDFFDDESHNNSSHGTNLETTVAQVIEEIPEQREEASATELRGNAVVRKLANLQSSDGSFDLGYFPVCKLEELFGSDIHNAFVKLMEEIASLINSKSNPRGSAELDQIRKRPSIVISTLVVALLEKHLGYCHNLWIRIVPKARGHVSAWLAAGRFQTISANDLDRLAARITQNLNLQLDCGHSLYSYASFVNSMSSTRQQQTQRTQYNTYPAPSNYIHQAPGVPRDYANGPVPREYTSRPSPEGSSSSQYSASTTSQNPGGLAAILQMRREGL
jgi:hypothetical protein